MSFYDFACSPELLENARQIAPAVMLQTHSVGDLADRGWLRERGKMRQYLLRLHMFGARFLFGLFLFAFHAIRFIYTRQLMDRDRLTEFTRHSKT